MTFVERLQQKKEAIVRRWFEAGLAAYPGEASAAFARQKDPFANPVGHSLRTGTRGVFEAMLDGMDEGRVRRHLEEMIRIRAVQAFPASRAVGFVFALKDAVRAELGESSGEPGIASELAGFEGRVDRVALAAFDLFVQCRERVYELRVQEVKRQVSWVVDRMNAGGAGPEVAQVGRTGTAPGEVQGEGRR